MVAKSAQGRGEMGIAGRNHPSFPGGEMLHGMETEDRHVGNAADSSASVQCAERVTCIFDQHQPVPIRQLQKRAELCRMSCIINWQQGSRPRADMPSCFCRVQIQSSR